MSALPSLAIPLGPVTLAFPEPSPPATVAETIIGVVLTLAAVMVFRASVALRVGSVRVRARWHAVRMMLTGLAGAFVLLSRQRRHSPSA